MGSRGRKASMAAEGWESVFELWMYGRLLGIESANGYEDARSDGLVVHLRRRILVAFSGSVSRRT